MTNIMYRIAVIAMTMCSIVPFTVLAHEEDASFEKVAGAYIVDIGYNPTAPRAESLLILDFKLRQAASSTLPADFTDVWVRVKNAHDDSTIVATNAYHGNTASLAFTPAKAGDIIIDVEYEKDGMQIASTTFSIPVEPEPLFSMRDTRPFTFGGAFILTMLLVVMRIRHNNKKKLEDAARQRDTSA